MNSQELSAVKNGYAKSVQSQEELACNLKKMLTDLKLLESVFIVEPKNEIKIVITKVHGGQFVTYVEKED